MAYRLGLWPTRVAPLHVSPHGKGIWYAVTGERRAAAGASGTSSDSAAAAATSAVVRGVGPMGERPRHGGGMGRAPPVRAVVPPVAWVHRSPRRHTSAHRLGARDTPVSEMRGT